MRATGSIGQDHTAGNRSAAAPASAVDVSVVVPTYNERDNIAHLVESLKSCLAGRSWEVIFVDDDSPDRTADVVREIARREPRVRCIQRIGRRGLSSACVEGMLASTAPYLAVMDADLQHDETLLPIMLDALMQEDLDVVVGSRYLAGGGIGEWSESRAVFSRIAARLSRMVVRADLSDPMSGFFVICRPALMESVRQLSAMGFKILLDLFASSPRRLRFKELPYEFRMRRAGESKFDNQAAWQYLLLLLDKLVGNIIPIRFISFTMVGAIGVGVHYLVLALLFSGLEVSFALGQAIATFIAMTGNYALNNVLTYRDMRLRGWQWLRGWVSFTIACSIGAFANVGVALYLFGLDTQWALAALAGILVGAVWNYVVTMVYTWRKPRAFA